MLTIKQLSKLKVGDVVWLTPKKGTKPIQITISRIGENYIYTNNIMVSKSSNLIHAELESAIKFINSQLNKNIKKLQNHIEENNKLLGDQNVKI